MEESNVFQGVGPDEMVISIAEYEEMKKKIEHFQKREQVNFEIRTQKNEEIEKLKLELEKTSYENNKLKRGIIKFVAIFGGDF